MPRPLLVPITSTFLMSLKTSVAVSTFPTVSRGGNSRTCRCSQLGLAGSWMPDAVRVLRRFDSRSPETAALCRGRSSRLVEEAELDGVIAVGFRRANLQHRTGTNLQHRHGARSCLVNLGHTDLDTQKAKCHGNASLCAEDRAVPIDAVDCRRRRTCGRGTSAQKELLLCALYTGWHWSLVTCHWSLAIRRLIGSFSK